VSYSYQVVHVQSSGSIAWGVTKRAMLTDDDHVRWKFDLYVWPWKVSKSKTLVLYHVSLRPRINIWGWSNHIALFCVFSFGPWWTSQESDRSETCSVSLVIRPRGTYVQSFSSIAQAVTKRAVFTDNGQWRRQTTHDRKSSTEVSQKTNGGMIFL
jgi:hypothetical protein